MIGRAGCKLQLKAVEDIQTGISFVKGKVIPELTDALKTYSGVSGKPKLEIFATGGGSNKFEKLLNEALGISLHKVDEMDSLVKGIHLLSDCKGEEPRYLDGEMDTKTCEGSPETEDPFLLVNIGSGVSIIKVSSRDVFKRVSGTSLGGGTYLGLMKTLTGAASFAEAVALSSKGNSGNVDLAVEDIYGSGYDGENLLSTMVASSFGKGSLQSNGLGSRSRTEPSPLKTEDIASSLLRMVAANIGNIAYLNAKCHSIGRVYFIGFFTENNRKRLVPL